MSNRNRKIESFICEHCQHGSEQIVDVKRPLFANSRYIKTVHVLMTYCSFYLCYKRKAVKECERYRPKAGKINDKITQKTLTEN